MFTTLKRMLKLGVEIASLTKKEAEKEVKRLVKSGKISSKEGEALVSKMMAETEKQRKYIRRMVKESAEAAQRIVKKVAPVAKRKGKALAKQMLRNAKRKVPKRVRRRIAKVKRKVRRRLKR